MKFIIFFLLFPLSLYTFGQGKAYGIIINKSDKLPVEYVHVELHNAVDNQTIAGAITDSDGRFTFDELTYGEYELIYSFIGFNKSEGIRFIISRDKPVVNLGALELEESAQELSEVVISGRRSTYVNKIDRKVFNVGEDLMSTSGSASDLLQNIPSVQIDVEGNVSLRGSENVQILINGRTSNLTKGASRVAVLQQLPANTIERIEIITNPSARYKPDGTSGIINIVLKKEKRPGMNGTWAANAGNENRYNSTLTLNYNPGKINIFGSYGIRLDDRNRYTYDNRTKINPETGILTYIDQNTDSKARPLSHIARGGIDWNITKKDKFEVGAGLTHMTFRRNETITNIYRDINLNETNNYIRFRDDDEWQKATEIDAVYTHTFEEDHELTLDYTLDWEDEQEDNKYTNQYFIPIKPKTYDNTLIRQRGGENLIRGNYTRSLGEEGKLDAGFDFEIDRVNMDFRGEYLENDTWKSDVEKTNRFVFEENIYALYATYEAEYGKFGVMGGVRGEYTDIKMRQKTQGTVIPSSYSNFYPTLHTAYHFNDKNEMQLNYSLRINRPEGDDMNPFPEYRDPLNINAGNPYLKPEKIHSAELGYMFRENTTTLIATAYYRYTFNKMTSVTRFVNDSVMLTTQENLSSSQSSGMEFIVNSDIGKAVTYNISANVYYNVIDASDLGYSKNKSTLAWNASLNANFNITRNLMAQLNTRYTAKSLTPQGYREPSFIMNLGARYDIFNKKASLLFTVSDLFNSFRQINTIDTPELKQRVERKRTSQIIYAGFVFHFGKSPKKPKEAVLKYDEGM